MVFAAVLLISETAWVPVAQSAGDTGPRAIVGVGLYAVATVTGLITWGAGMVLAMRSRSLIWMAVACVPPPFGAVICALWAPKAPAPTAR